jgi:hypothetical protein
LIRDFRQGRGFVARLDHGTDIIGQITELAKGKEIETGIFSVIGALSRAELGYYDQASQKYGVIQLFDPMELVYCSGNISLRNDQPFVHAHAVLSDRKGMVRGGHLNAGMVFAAELYMQELLGQHGQHLKRVPDSITGLNLWSEE